MTVRPRIPLAAAAATLAAAAFAPSAHAAWGPPLGVTSDPRASIVRAAGTADGREAFVWQVTTTRVLRLPAQTGNVGYVRARMRLANGRLGAVQTISTTHGIVTGAQIGLDAAGNATAVWTQAGAHLSIMAAYRPHGKRFGTPFELGRSTHFDDALAQLAVGRLGDAVVAWNDGRHVEVARRSATCSATRPAACFRRPIALAQGSDQAVAIGPLGSAYVVWAAGVHSGEDFHTQLRLVVLRRSGRRGVDHALTAAADGDASQPSLAVRDDGTAVVAWRASLPTGGEQNEPGPIKAVTSSPDAVVSPVQTVATGSNELPVVRVDGEGEAILAWHAFDSTPANPDGPQVMAAVAPAGATTFGAPVMLSPPDRLAGIPSLAVDAAGTAYLVYGVTPVRSSAPDEPSALSHVRPAGAAFGPATALPAGFGDASVLAAGARVTAVSTNTQGRTLLSDWAP